jgi:ribosomal protein S18 acetylase RimI-like enzyme
VNKYSYCFVFGCHPWEYVCALAELNEVLALIGKMRATWVKRMTEGTWNLYLIAVHPKYQRQGRGAALLAQVEKILVERGERMLLVETSGLDSFDYVRSFYHKNGYEEEARIRDFYQVNDDKIVFRKTLVG